MTSRETAVLAIGLLALALTASAAQASIPEDSQLMSRLNLSGGSAPLPRGDDLTLLAGAKQQPQHAMSSAKAADRHAVDSK